jgi:hypothetical protein
MQVTPHAAPGTAHPLVVASQTIDILARREPSGTVVSWSTDREIRLAGERSGIDTFASVDDAIAAARQLSAGELPGLAVLTWGGGFRLHDVRTVSHTYLSTSPASNSRPPVTRETKRSNVPFSAGNVRPSGAGTHNNPAVARDRALAALVDGARVFRPDTSSPWSGQPRLVEA